MSARITAARLGAMLLATSALSGIAAAETIDLAAAGQISPVLDTIIVTGTKERALEVGGSVQLLDSEDLETFSYGDPNRVLRQVPGVFLQEEEGFGLRPNIGIRGSGTDRNGRISVMEDGVLIAPAPYAAPAAYYFPRIARISAVEVSKGPASIKYGPQTVGGALNLFSTPIPETFGGRAEALFGNYDGRRLYGHAGGWTPVGGGVEIGLLAEGLYEHSNGFKRIDIGGDTGFAIQDYLGKIGLRSADGRHILEFKYQNFDERSDETYLGLTLADFRADPWRRYNGSQVDRMDVSHETLQLSHSFDVSPAFNLTTIAYRHDTTRTWYKLNDVASGGALRSISAVLDDPVTFAEGYRTLVGAAGFTSAANALRVRNNNRMYEAKGVQSVATARFMTGAVDHALEVSLRYHEDEEDRFQQDDRYQMVDGRMVLTAAGAPGSQENRIGSANAWAFFVRDTITAGPLTLVPGLRYETIDLRRTDFVLGDTARATPSRVIDSQVDVLIPGIAATYRLTPDLRLIGGVHRGFASPGPGGSVDVETSWNYEAGLRYGNTLWRAEAIAFFNDYDNLVGTCTASTGGDCTIGDQFDGGAVHVKGIEALAGYSFAPAGGLLTIPVSLAYTYTDASFRTSFTSAYGPWGNVTRGDRLPYLPRHQVTLNAGLEGAGWRVSTTLNHVSVARATAGQGPIPAGDRVDARTLVDIAGEVDLWGGISAFGTVQNLFDETYNVAFSPAGARPGAPRLVLAGLKARF